MDFLSNIDPVALAALTFAVVGFVELLNRVFDKDYRGAATIAVAGLAGALFSGAVDITPFNGLLIGFGASGLVTLGTRVGGRS